MPGRQGRLLFGYLVANRERACGRAELIDVLWPAGAPSAAESALSALLSKLRRALGAQALAGRADLRLVLDGPVRVDAETAEAEIAATGPALEARDWRRAATHARAALRVEPQTFLTDCDGPWVQERRRDLETVRLHALEALAEAGLRLGGRELGAAEQAARSAIADAPFRESAYRLLMEILDAAGNQAEAMRAYDELRVRLRDELGTSPGPAIQEVHSRLLRGDAPSPPPPAPPNAAPDPAATASPPWPGPLAAVLDREAFVGRAADLGVLQESWQRVRDGGRELLLLAGEAGIGKTRLAAEFTATAHADGALVLYGRFDEESVAPYQPVVEMLRGYAAQAPLAPLRERLGARAPELGILLPEFGAVADDRPTPGWAGAEPDARRYRFFDAVAGLLGELGARRPVVLVFDDLHWADRPTLQLLRHLVRAPEPPAVLFLGTYRDTELRDAHPLRELVADLRREGAVRRLDVTGLREVEVAALVAAIGGRPPADRFARALHGETEGNPFFIEEVVRHLLESGGDVEDVAALADSGVPEGVREVTGRRLKRLSDDARQTMLVASVIGPRFDFDLLEEVSPVVGDALVGALDEGVDARVLREVDGQVGRYAFTHALIRATLYDTVSALRRARLHGRIGEAVLALRGADLDPHLAQLAHHFAAAVPVELLERAVDFAIQAGRRADRLLAWEEAADHYRDALRTLELAGAADDRVRGDLLLMLGASLERAGADEAEATFATALDVARALGAAPLLAQAALGYAGPWNILGEVGADRVGVLEEALAALGAADSALRARLLARLTLELYYSGDAPRRLALSEEAVALARRLGDPRTLATCLDARHYALWRPETLQERLTVAAELSAIADEIGDRELALEGAGWTIVDLAELGDLDGVERRLESMERLLAEVNRPLYAWWTGVFRTMIAQIVGDFESAERLALETLAVGQRGQAENAVHYFSMQLYNIRREQGRVGELEEAVRAYIQRYPALPAWRSTLALLLVELGRTDEARTVFDRLAAPGFDALPRDANWLIAVTLLAEVCGALKDAARAEELHTLLAPYARRNVIVGRGATCNGSASRLLGILAAAMGSSEEAEAHFEEALEMHAGMRARPWTARTQVAYAEMLLARGGDGDRAQALERLDEAARLASELGMVSLSQAARRLERSARRRRSGAPVTRAPV